MNPPKDAPSIYRPSPELKAALLEPMPSYTQAARLSLFIGVLMLAPSWYMFEVYGRVLNSRNPSTLWWLLLAAVVSYVVLELLEVVRSRVLGRAGRQVGERLTKRIFDAAFTANLRRLPLGNAQGLSDVRTVSDFISSPAVSAVLDLPASLLCLALLFAMSPWLGVLALVSAAIQAVIGAYQERRSSRPYGEASLAAAEAQLRAAGSFRNVQVIESMGMQYTMHERWMQSQQRFMLSLAQASDRAGAASAASKMVVNLQGSLLLGLAAWLGVTNNLLGGAGMAIVASILGGRVLAPMGQLVTQWRQIGQARTAYRRTALLLNSVPLEPPGLPLPQPEGKLLAEGLLVTPPGATAPVLKGVSFFALPGEVLAVIGPSAAGKSVLARVLIGVWPTQAGKVRLDGADVYSWNKSDLGPHVGYLSQGVELFDGSIAENIARFGKVDMDLVRAAADDVGISAMVAELPDGFDTQIGDAGAVLSGGQRQRIGLARAIYGNPRLLVLDEPNSSLDEAGEKELIALLRRLKERGATVVAITHRPSLLAVADKMLLINEGQTAKFGPRDDVLASLKAANEQAARSTVPRVQMASGAPLPRSPA